jgi:hypothetical protein
LRPVIAHALGQWARAPIVALVVVAAGFGTAIRASSVDPGDANDAALRAVDTAAVAIFAFRDAHGRPMAWPVTPYREGASVAITSTLAFMQKAVHVRRDGRVGLLVGGFQLSGQAHVHGDVSGDEFAQRFLDQELRKYPPTRDLVRIPFHRTLLSWYFGRVIMEFTPSTVRPAPGADRSTLVTLDAQGFPLITPIAEPNVDAKAFSPQPLSADAVTTFPDGPALVLVHMEPSMTDLRQLALHGHLREGVFSVRSRRGSLLPEPQRGWWAQLQQQLGYRRRARQAKAIIRAWGE